MIPNIIEQYDKFIGDPVEFIVFCSGLNEHLVVSHFRYGCKHRIFVRNYDHYERKDRQYLKDFGGGYLVLFMNEDDTIDKKELDNLFSVILEKGLPSFYKDGELKIYNREGKVVPQALEVCDCEVVEVT
jgi:hypothetical protein